PRFWKPLFSGQKLQPIWRKMDGRSHLETKFLLYSDRAEEGCLIEFQQLSSLESCRFNASLPLVMIVHGWSVRTRLSALCLDPAGPLFEGMSATDRLSPDDADFVDAVHTFTQQQMGLSVGIEQPVAHFDFYPNGGTFQPGCHIIHVYNHIVQYGITGLAQTVKCAHERSVHLFIDSLHHDKKQMTGYWCKDMQTFDKGRCLNCRANRCNTLGYHIRKAKFKIHFINEFRPRQIDPTFTISLTGSKDDVENLSITLMTFCSQIVDDLRLYPGQEKMFVRCEQLRRAQS
ncbi:hypothetical protein JD844_014043, partial [Phrynosoma platyrhinos]